MKENQIQISIIRGRKYLEEFTQWWMDTKGLLDWVRRSSGRQLLKIMEKQRFLLKITVAACSCELYCDVCHQLDLWSNTGFMTHPKALWRRNTKRCPSATFKIENMLDIFLCVPWHRSHHCAPTVFIIGKKITDSPFSSPDSSGRSSGCFSGEGCLQMLWGLLPSSTQ